MTNTTLSFRNPRHHVHLGGVLFTIGAVVGVELTNRYVWQVIPYPAAIYLLPISFATLVGGIRTGLVSTVIIVAWGLASLIIPGGFYHTLPDGVARFTSLALIFPVFVVMVDALRNRIIRREQRLRESEERLRLLTGATGEALYDRNFKTGTVWRNAGYLRLLKPPTHLEKNADWWETRLHPDDREQTLASLRSAFDRREPVWTSTYRFQCEDGTELFLTDQAALIYDETGSPVRIVGAMSDISARKQAEAALQEEAQVSTALVRVGQAVMESASTAMVLHQLCQTAVAVVECDYSIIHLWQPEDTVYRAVATHGCKPEHQEVVQAVQITPEMIGNLPARLAQGLVEVKAGTDQPPFTQVMFQVGVKAFLVIPLRRGDEVIGGQSVGFYGRTEFTPTQKRIAQGIGQLGSLVLENARLLEQAEGASRLKSQFLSIISHELRTPLHIIAGYTEMLLEGMYGPLEAEPVHLLKRMYKTTQELRELITSMLDLSRLELGHASVHLTPVEIPSLLQELQEEMAEVSRAKSTLVVNWPSVPDLPALCTDHTKLKIVLKNLLLNAIKFTDTGSVTFFAQPDREGIEFRVVDTGIGITPEVQAVMFEMFRQGESSETRRYSGAGLGLYVVKRMLEILKGTITVTSTPGQGSTFRVWIPARPESSQSS